MSKPWMTASVAAVALALIACSAAEKNKSDNVGGAVANAGSNQGGAAAQTGGTNAGGTTANGGAGGSVGTGGAAVGGAEGNFSGGPVTVCSRGAQGMTISS